MLARPLVVSVLSPVCLILTPGGGICDAQGIMNKPLPRALVTGSSRGLGRSVAVSLAGAGFEVVIHCAANREAAEETVRLCTEAAPDKAARFPVVAAALDDAGARQRLVDESFAALGGLDALVNNAGMAPRQRLDLLNATEESYREVMGVNLQGPYFLTQAVARRWLAEKRPAHTEGGPKIVFVTSVSANTASVGRGEYCLSKAGLAMAAQLWATRLAAEGIQVYEVRPGIMQTDMTVGVQGKYDDLIAQGLVPQMRWGQPSDVGKAVCSLLRGDWPFSTGSVLHVDGGLHLRRL